MARVGRSIPAALAFLVLGAHFYRAADVALAVACVVVAGLSFVRRPRVVLGLQMGLVAGSVLWVVTAWRIAEDRMGAGMPYVRMLLILGAVAAFTALSAWLLRAPRRD